MMSGGAITILGCSGGGGDNLLTTCFRVGEHILIDAGTGLGAMSSEDMALIDHVLITHSHQDHIALLPLFLERIYLLRKQPVTVYARAETLSALKDHVFNWEIYPDFSELPLIQQQDSPLVRFREIKVQETVQIGGWRVCGAAMDHTVPGLSYILQHDGMSFAFTGDTRSLSALAQADPFDVLVTELSYPDHMHELARLSGHMTPAILKRDLALLRRKPQLWISHLKPQYHKELRLAAAPLLAEYGGRVLESGGSYPLAARGATACAP
ncbi:MAG: 3',5'-cyclic-nucleotide phosphodiesterase [Gammaproteobacteria bacterium]|nr:MAG: 3',5'-cyclic-nucleotide phosphodiesterase [Gammaproteobacteria bacterium]